MAKGDGVILGPDGFQYGVRFRDGSVAARWSGGTQRDRAEQYRDLLAERYPSERDWYRVVRRVPGGEWVPVPAG